MKKIVWGLVIALAGAGALAPDVADARRLGGGGSAGLKRQAPPPQQRAPQQAAPQQQAPAQQAVPPQQAAPAAAAAPTAGAGAAAAAAAPKRSWLGPIAGLAAGLGIAALLSHLGLGAAFAEFLTLLLLVIVGFVVVRWLLRRFAPAGAGNASQGVRFAGAPGSGGPLRFEPPVGAGAASGGTPAAPAATAAPADGLPGDFDRAGFERIAKLIFIRMQAANDAGDVQDLRRFTTPQMFAEVQLELQQRAGRSQRTDVVQLDAEVQDSAAEEDGQQVVSVRFHGLIREEQDGAAAPFDEIWHFVRPLDGSREWAIAGIAQNG